MTAWTCSVRASQSLSEPLRCVAVQPAAKGLQILLATLLLVSSSPAVGRCAQRSASAIIDEETKDRVSLEDRQATAYENANSQTATAISRDLETQIYEARALRYGNRNPYLQRMADMKATELENELRFKISAIKRRYALDSQEARQAANQRQLALKGSCSALKEQLADTSAKGIHLMPEGTNLYVRNYTCDPAIELVANQKCLNGTRKQKMLEANRNVYGTLLR